MTEDRYAVEMDGLTYRPRFSRRYAVVDTLRLGPDGKPPAVLETDDPRRARDYCAELNQGDLRLGPLGG